MALTRLFQHSRDRRRPTWCSGNAKKDELFESPEVLTSHKCWQAPILEEKQIRLVVFKECDLKGKRILIDSKAIQKVEPNANEASPNTGRLGRCYQSANGEQRRPPERPSQPSNILDGYKFSRPGSDVTMLGEMLFGSIPMSSSGPIIKVHTFKMPSKLMLSRVFPLKPPRGQLEPEGGDKDAISLYCADMTIPRSISENNLPAMEIARSLPIAMPTPSPGRGLDDSSGEFTASGSFLTPFLPSSPGSSVSSSASTSSLHRRWLRNQLTSMENVVRRRSSENINSAEEPIRPRKRYPKIGVAVLFSLPEEPSGKEDQEFRRFFFSHFTLLESHFQRLVSAIERALISQKKTYFRPSPIMEALQEFKSTVFHLYTAPRIQKPVWLNLMTYPQQRGHLCAQLVRELGTLLEAHNTRQTNFFMSRLLSGVLMHHLAWVSTVVPAGSAPCRAFLDKHSSTTLDMLAKSHPYNPLWAQLGDIYGTIGLPNRVAKTVVTGKRADVVCRLLYVLSYFIRCSEVHEVHEKCEDIVLDCTDMSELADPEDKLDRRRTLTEESFIAKTEDSGIMDVGLTASEASEKPVFYIQDSSTFDQSSGQVETSSDDGVSLESETVDVSGQSRCIQGFNKCNQANGDIPQTRTSDGVEESDEVFDSRLQEVNRISQVQVKADSETCVAETSIEVQILNDRNDNTTAEPAIVCKMVNLSMLDSKVECVTPVGRAVKSIDEILSFDMDSAPPSVTSTKDTAENLPCRTLPNEEQQPCNPLSVINPTSGQVCVDSSLSTLSNSSASDHISVPNHVSSPCRKTVSDSIDIVTNSAQRTTDSKCPSQLADPGHCFNSESNPTTDDSHHLACQDGGNASKQNQSATARLEAVGQGDCRDRTALCNRSVSSLSGVSCASSSLSHLSHLSDHTCPDHVELPLASSEQLFEMELEQTRTHVDNFGRSLLGGYSQHFVPDFALQGVPQLDMARVEKSLQDSTQHPVLDESGQEPLYIVANTDSWTVEEVSCERYQGCVEKPTIQEVAISTLVDQLLESVKLLHRMKLSSDFCLMHLEDRLQELFFHSTAVAGLLEHKPMVKAAALAGAVGVDRSDLPLLLAIASVHSPHVIANVMRETIEQQRMALQQDSP
ncbi:folliculin-interacting protein 2-like [Diadema antillarum]|uniref:folliculin-interacting protein 2-like n=1 Tax=Diadema antillarum TaxID=105358 RepID=UPI003A89F7BE